MDPWEQLFSEFESARNAREEHLARITHDQRQLELRRDQAASAAMDALATTLAERAAEFEARGAGRIAVRHPSHPPLCVPRSGVSMRFLALSLGLSTVDLYLHHRIGRAPWIHFCHRWTDDRRPRLVSMVGARVAPTTDGFELLAPPTSGQPAERCSVDSLAFRVVRLLLTAERGRLKRFHSAERTPETRRA